MIKAIDTEYQGYRFRSRLEARWAVYFDLVKVAWEYEPQGFDMGDRGWYLPDFRLPDLNAWVEIKPSFKDGKLYAQVYLTLQQLAKETGSKAWGFLGDPLDHHWLEPGDSIVPEWALSTAISFERDENGEIEAMPTFSLSGFKGDLMWSSSVTADFAIGNFEDKTKSRQARFEHGETPRLYRTSSKGKEAAGKKCLADIKRMLGKPSEDE